MSITKLDLSPSSIDTIETMANTINLIIDNTVLANTFNTFSANVNSFMSSTQTDIFNISVSPTTSYHNANNIIYGTIPVGVMSGTYNISVSGTAAQANKLSTSRKITLTGDVSGFANFDGSANVSISSTVADDSHNHSISTITNLQSSLDAKFDKLGGTINGDATITGITSLSAGSLLSPSLRFIDDVYTGICRTGANKFGFVVNQQLVEEKSQTMTSFSTRVSASTNNPLSSYIIDRQSPNGAGTFINLTIDGTQIGRIDTVDGTTVRYLTFTGAHWSQKKDDITDVLPGTVMSTIDEMCSWYTLKGKNFEGDIDFIDMPGKEKLNKKIKSTVLQDAVVVNNHKSNRLPKCKVSDVVGDSAVYGVYSGQDDNGDITIESLGVSIIRMSANSVAKRGDLVESNGDGTAKVQDDDIIRSKTIGKITSNITSTKYDDGSYLLPIVLYCG